MLEFVLERAADHQGPGRRQPACDGHGFAVDRCRRPAICQCWSSRSCWDESSISTSSGCSRPGAEWLKRQLRISASSSTDGQLAPRPGLSDGASADSGSTSQLARPSSCSTSGERTVLHVEQRDDGRVAEQAGNVQDHPQATNPGHVGLVGPGRVGEADAGRLDGRGAAQVRVSGPSTGEFAAGLSQHESTQPGLQKGFVVQQVPARRLRRPRTARSAATERSAGNGAYSFRL